MAITPIPVSVSNPTGTVALSASGLPTGLTFTDNGNGTGDITGTVAQGEALNSPFVVTITATDDVATDDETFLLTVTPPALKPNVSGLANPLSASRVLTDFDLASLTANATDVRSEIVEVGHNLIACVPSGGNYDRLLIVDVSTPSAPTLVSDTVLFATTSGSVTFDVDVAGQTLYVCKDETTPVVYAVDISDPATPVVTSSTAQETAPSSTYFSSAVLFTGSLVAVLSGSSSPSTLYLSLWSPDLSTRHYYALLDTPGWTDSRGYASLAANGNSLWVSGESDTSGESLILLDTSNPATPTLEASFTASAAGKSSNPPICFLPGTASGDVVVRGYSINRNALAAFPATGAETGSEAAIATLTGMDTRPFISSTQHVMAADLNNVLYVAGDGSNTVSVVDASAPATAFAVDNTLTTGSHSVASLCLTDGKVIGADTTGLISIWV